MSDDIVTRLRDEAHRPAMREVCTAAANEIERLREERDAWQAAATAYEMGLMSTGDFLVKETRCRFGSVGAAEMVVQEVGNG